MEKKIHVVTGVDGADWYCADTQFLFGLPDQPEWQPGVWIWLGNFMSMDWRGHHLANVIRSESCENPGTWYAARGPQEDAFLQWLDGGDDSIDIEALVFSHWGIPERVARYVNLDRHSEHSPAWNNALRDFYLDFYDTLVDWLRLLPCYIEYKQHVIIPMNHYLQPAMLSPSSEVLIGETALPLPTVSSEHCGGLWWIDGNLKYELPSGERSIITYDPATQMVNDGRYRKLLPELEELRRATWW